MCDDIAPHLISVCSSQLPCSYGIVVIYKFVDNWLINTKKGSIKLLLFHGNIERLMNIYDYSLKPEGALVKGIF